MDTSSISLRLGRYQDVMQDVEADCCIDDPPYSEKTHDGQSELRGDLQYSAWTPDDVHEFVAFVAPRTRSWMAVMTDDVLAPHYREAYEAAGRFSFAAVPLLAHQPRLGGDGPGSGAVWLCVCRPRERRFAQWGSLPCWYNYVREVSATGVLGAKPLSLMRAIVRDYSKPGDLIADYTFGGATTLLAAALEGRRAIGAEMDPETFEKAQLRIAHGNSALRSPNQLRMEF